MDSIWRQCLWATAAVPVAACVNCDLRSAEATQNHRNDALCSKTIRRLHLNPQTRPAWHIVVHRPQLQSWSSRETSADARAAETACSQRRTFRSRRDTAQGDLAQGDLAQGDMAQGDMAEGDMA